MGQIDGLITAGVAPLLYTLGFFVWQQGWQGSAYVFNAIKGCLASLGFIVTIALLSAADSVEHPLLPDATASDVAITVASGILGILIGDSLWLLALLRIGARRVLLMDSIKPFLAAIAAASVLGEPVTPGLLLGMLATTGGVVTVALEREKVAEANEAAEVPEEGKRGEASEVPKKAEQGVVGVVCGSVAGEDSAGDAREPGATVVEQRRSSTDAHTGENAAAHGLVGRQQGPGGSPADSASTQVAVRAAASERTSPTAKNAQAISAAQLYAGLAYSALNCVFDVAGAVMVKLVAGNWSTFQINLARFGSAGSILAVAIAAAHAARPGAVPPWAQVPALPRRTWLRLFAGIALVTYATPALTAYALFELNFAVYTTLVALGPLWALPVGWLFCGERVTRRAFLGTLVALGGLVPLAQWRAETGA